MMISPAGARDPYAAAAALDRELRSSSDGSNDAPDALVAAGPDVVVTLSQGPASAPSTYDASGRMAGGGPTLDDRGANAPDSLAKATESVDGGDATSNAGDSPANEATDATVAA